MGRRKSMVLVLENMEITNKRINVILKTNAVITARSGLWSRNMIWAPSFSIKLESGWSRGNANMMLWSRQWSHRMGRTWTFRGGR